MLRDPGTLVCAVLLSASACKSDPSQSTAQRGREVSVLSVSAAQRAAPMPNRVRQLMSRACHELLKLECDVRENACQSQLFELAKCVSGQVGIRPTLRVISEKESKQLRLAHRGQGGHTRKALEHALSTLGLGKPDADEDESLHDRALGGSAYYAPRERQVYFVASEATLYSGELAVLGLVHEYVHSLQDRHGELLAALNGAHERTFDEDLTLWSAFEGEASLYEEVVRALVRRQPPHPERFALGAEGSDQAIVRQRRPLEASFATFPYTYGAHWATLEIARPESTQQLLARRHGWPAADAQRCDDETPAELSPDYPRRRRDTLGAWLAQAYVRRQTSDPQRARSAARRWRGDWMALYSRTPVSAASFIWQTCWDSAATAVEMRELMAEQLRVSSADRALVTADGLRVTALVNAEDLAEPTEQTAPRLLQKE
jgi:hypothetical protein